MRPCAREHGRRPSPARAPPRGCRTTWRRADAAGAPRSRAAPRRASRLAADDRDRGAERRQLVRGAAADARAAAGDDGHLAGEQAGREDRAIARSSKERTARIQPSTCLVVSASVPSRIIACQCGEPLGAPRHRGAEMTHAMIFDAVRTPRGKGKKDGSLHEVKPVDLLAGAAGRSCSSATTSTRRSSTTSSWACVSPVGEQGSVIAKTAALKAGWDVTVAGMQINRFCASGLEAVNMAAQKVRERLGRPGRRRRRREHVARADRLRRRRLGAGPGDQLRDRLRAAGHRRRPDRHARRLGRARTSTATR